MVERTVPGFLPSRFGLHFANRFPPGPTVRLGPIDPSRIGIGDASAGLCGGMALTAFDLWAAGLPAPPGDEPPGNGSRRFRALVRRQVESLDWLRVPFRYAVLGLLHGPLARGPLSVRAVRREWPRVRSDLDAGRPCLIELIRVVGVSPAALTRNHQVLAFGYASAVEDDRATVRIRVYDPNHPDRDDVALELAPVPDAGRAMGARVAIRQTTGEPVLGFFRGPSPRPGPVGAWR